jgi:predicted ArsR family transcriptional regulator
MAHGIADARRGGRPVTEKLGDAARQHGRELAGQTLRRAGDGPSDAALRDAACEVLDDEGYATRSDPAGLTLTNCPFRALAAEHTDVVCGLMNLAIMEGMLDGQRRLRLAAVREPAEGRCCVRLAAEGNSAG